MPSIRELREERAGVWAQAQEFLERSKTTDLSAEDEAAWQRALAEIDRLGDVIENRERTEALDTRFAEIDAETRNAPDGTADDGVGQRSGDDGYRDVFVRWMRDGLQGLDPAERSLLQNRAQQVATGGAGGYTVPQGFWAKVTESMKYYGGILGNVELLTTDSGNDIPWPTNDDTSNTGAQLDEGDPVTELALTFGQKELGAYTYTSRLILVSLLLMQDTGVDLEGFLSRRMGERLGRIINTRLTTGTGSSQPQGLVTGLTTGKTTASATAITYNEIVDLVHSVDVAYRSADAKFMMNDLVLAYVRKIRDDSGGAGVGRPLWEPSVQVGVPDSLLGYGLVVNNDMASTVATTNKTIAFGDFQSAYVARLVNGGMMKRLEERYAEYLQVGFFGFQRADGLVQDAGAAKLLVQA